MSRRHYQPRGVIAAMVTPFKDDGSLDEERFRSHLLYLIDCGIHGVLIMGGSGEYANLTPDERTYLVHLAMQVVDKRIPVVVGALGTSTPEAIAVGSSAAQAGASALLLLPPYYIKPSTDGVITHYQTVANETGLDIIAYNNPGRTGWAMTAEFLQELASVSAVVGLKECDRDLASISRKLTLVGERIAILSGDDDLGYATLLSGARGAIWASPNLHPKLCLELYHACLRRNLDVALPLHNRLVHVMHRWMIANHPGPLKEALEMVGRSVGPARAPLARMNDAERSALASALEVYGPIE